jgi:hypothetical protein
MGYESNNLFCGSLVDDFGMTPCQFRLLHHLHRRIGTKTMAKCGIRGISRVCKMNKDTVSQTIRELETLNVISCRRRQKSSSEYQINPFDQWIKTSAQKKNCPSNPDRLTKKLSPKTGQAVRNEGTDNCPKRGT